MIVLLELQAQAVVDPIVLLVQRVVLALVLGVLLVIVQLELELCVRRLEPVQLLLLVLQPLVQD